MSFEDDVRQELGPYFEDRQRRLFQADILFEGDPLSANGKALLDTDGLAGVFWQKGELIQDKNLATAKILRKSANWQVEIKNLREVQSGLGSHYRFELVQPFGLSVDGVRYFDWKTSEQVLRHQLEKFQIMFGPDIEKSPVGNRLSPPEKVWPFARDLMLCATEQAVASHIGQDREAARACWILSDDFATAENKERIQLLIPDPPFETPFFLLASIALARAQLAIERHGGTWGTH